MQLINKHLILIGFKHVGKSVIGKALSQALKRPFLDLDEQVESLYQAQHADKKNCRQMMQTLGEKVFRTLETQALQQVIQEELSILSLGGGTPLSPQNQQLIQSHCIIHITAPQGIVFERIMMCGRPAFFSDQENPFDIFSRLWKEREAVYKTLTSLSVCNDGSIEQTAQQIIHKMEQL